MVTVPVKCSVRASFCQDKCNVTSCQTSFVKLAYFFIWCDWLQYDTPGAPSRDADFCLLQ